MSFHLAMSNLLTHFSQFLASIEPDVNNPQTVTRIQARRAKFQAVSQQILTRGVNDLQRQVNAGQKMLAEYDTRRNSMKPEDYAFNRRWMVEDLERSQRELEQIQIRLDQITPHPPTSPSPRRSPSPPGQPSPSSPPSPPSPLETY